MHWTWRTHLLRIQIAGCGHQFEDRPPRSSMSAAEITAWIERFYAQCPMCPTLQLIDPRALLLVD